MERQAMYRFLQACLTGHPEYMTTEGVTCYHAPTSGDQQHTIVLDVLIDFYLQRPGQTIELSIPDTAASIDVSAVEIVRSVLALAKITLVSQHIEERLIRVVTAGIDHRGRLTLVIRLNTWLSYHLNQLTYEEIKFPSRVHVI